MAKKRTLHHYYTEVRQIEPRILAVLFAISLIVTLAALRDNNLRMIQLREEVFTADERGEGVEDALNELRSYVYGHMNTDLTSGGLSIRPPIQLKHTYDRLVSEENEKVASINETVSDRATSFCESRFPAGQIQARARCVQEYITANSAKAKQIPKELYQFDFASPRWSPDFAGYSLLVTIVLGALLALRLIIGYGLKLFSK